MLNDEVGSIVECELDNKKFMARIEDIKHNGDEIRIVVSDGQHLFDMKPENVKKAQFKVVDRDKNKHDPVNHPSHYTDGKIEVIDFINDKKLNFNRGNVIKYVSRAGKKASKALDMRKKEIQDLEKALFYLNDEIKRLKLELTDIEG